MSISAIATQRPDRDSAGPMCSESRALRASASEAAVVANRIPVVRSATPTTARDRLMCARRIRAYVAANPAGTQATTILPNGCAPREASSSSGSAPAERGPTSSACIRSST